MDAPADIASGEVPGVKRAAVRKLRHELGIQPEQLPLADFRWAVGPIRQRKTLLYKGSALKARSGAEAAPPVGDSAGAAAAGRLQVRLESLRMAVDLGTPTCVSIAAARPRWGSARQADESQRPVKVRVRAPRSCRRAAPRERWRGWEGWL